MSELEVSLIPQLDGLLQSSVQATSPSSQMSPTPETSSPHTNVGQDHGSPPTPYINDQRLTQEQNRSRAALLGQVWMGSPFFPALLPTANQDNIREEDSENSDNDQLSDMIDLVKRQKSKYHK